jgi:Tfp pilus assembly protein PilE
MGQQQLLLLVLAVIIVGIAIVVGITMFRAQSASANLDAVTNDLMNLASRAQQYWVRPTSMGGGGGDFTGGGTGLMTLAQLTPQPTNDNGTYSLGALTTTTAIINGVGTQNGDGVGGNCAANVLVTMPAGTIVLTVTDR